MTLPANIRVNATFPFPSLVQGSGPITIAKNNGIWTIGFTSAAFASQVPSAPSFATDFLLAYDAVNNTFFSISLATLISLVNVSAGASRTQRTTTTTPITVGPTDQIISTKITSAAACTLPSAASRVGVPVTFKDLGQASAHNITITAAGGDTIDGAASFVMNINYASVTLVPFNDGTNTGWMVQ